MPKKTIAPQMELARQHRKNELVGTPPLTPVIANNFRLATLEQQQLGIRLAEYQQKLTCDYRRAIAAAEWAEARTEALNDLFFDLEYFNSDGGVYASDV